MTDIIADLNAQGEMMKRRLLILGRLDCVKMLDRCLPAESEEEIEHLNAVLAYIEGEFD